MNDGEKLWWVSFEGLIGQYYGEPRNNEYWYFKDIGYSLAEGYFVFETMAEAIAHTREWIADMESELSVLAGKLDRLEEAP